MGKEENKGLVRVCNSTTWTITTFVILVALSSLVLPFIARVRDVIVGAVIVRGVAIVTFLKTSV